MNDSIMMLGGFYYEGSERVQFPLVKSPDFSELLKMLKVLEIKSGVLSLEQESSNEYGANELSLYSENGSYLVMYGCYDKDGDYTVLTLLDNKKSKNEMINILGEAYPSNIIVKDFLVVSKVFGDFLETGEPNNQLSE